MVTAGPYRPMPNPSRRMFKGNGSVHRHFGGMTRTDDGVLHLLHRRAPEHGVSGAGDIVYCTIAGEGGGALSAEVIFEAAGPGRDLRDCDILVTPSGRMIAQWTDNSATSGTVYFMSKYSDDNGAAWSVPSCYDTIAMDFSRNYGAVTVVPGGRLAKPGYKQTGASQYRCGLYWSDDDGATWAEGAPIHIGTTNALNETAVVFIDAFTGFACIRGGGLYWSVTRDGGSTWSAPKLAAWSSTQDVAPTLNVVVVGGVPYVLLGYCDRVSDETKWRWARPDLLLSGVDSMRHHLRVTATDMENNSGYQKPFIYPSGEMLWVEYREYLSPDKSSDVRVVYGSPVDWIQNEIGVFSPILKGTKVQGSPTYYAREGAFVKIGRQVTARVRIDITNRGGMSGQVAIGNLPFKVASGPVMRAPVKVSFVTGHNIGSYGSIVGFAFDDTNEFRLNMVGATSQLALMHTNITDDLVLYASVTYETEE